MDNPEPLVDGVVGAGLTKSSCGVLTVELFSKKTKSFVEGYELQNRQFCGAEQQQLPKFPFQIVAVFILTGTGKLKCKNTMCK